MTMTLYGDPVWIPTCRRCRDTGWVPVYGDTTEFGEHWQSRTLIRLEFCDCPAGERQKARVMAREKATNG